MEAAIEGRHPTPHDLLLPHHLQPRYPGEFFVLLLRTLVLGGDPPLLRRMATGGDVTQVHPRRGRLVLLTHPDDIKQVLVTDQRAFSKGYTAKLLRARRLLGEGLLTSEGEFHLRQRRLVQPAFHRERIAGYAAVMADYTRRATEQWREGVTLDIHDEMMHITRDIAGKTLFDLEIGEDPGEVDNAVALSMRVYRLAMLFGAWVERLPIPVVVRWRVAMARLDAWLSQTIAQRRRDGLRGDLLSLLLAAQDVEESEEGMDDLQVRDEIVTILVAAHETTAVALSWTWYMLSQHPEVETRLHAELAEVLGGRLPTAGDIPKLTYTRMVFAEALRMYPPAWVLERQALRDVDLEAYRIPAGSFVLVSPYLVHRDPRWYPNPDQFDPERWQQDAMLARPKFSYFPFGGGTRICVGEQFAWMEGILLLATIAQRWRLILDPRHRVAFRALVTLRPQFGMHMRVVRR
jgi:cytochrome P450